ncbi:type IV pilin [Halobacterium noricense]|uniref:type IV pilin n=1 Tax=Halobacterium noricense TaxID=223182 RepID=UPI001E51C28E|nr:type IV pilin [Halobacterium noricense]UHH24930.1 type IV pilin [Halobacterium noricense]
MKKITMFEMPDDDERGVSPVIGVILMVAITVILAAVIASFVLGFGDQVSQNVQAGADISETDDGSVTATWISEGNADHLNVSVSDDSNVAFDESSITGYAEIQQVGNTATLTTDGDSPPYDVTVTVTAVGSGGSRTVVAQEEVSVGSS